MSRAIEVIVEVRVTVESESPEADRDIARATERAVSAACKAKPGLVDHFDLEAMSWDEVKMGEIACKTCRHVRSAHDGINAPGCALCGCDRFSVAPIAPYSIDTRDAIIGELTTACERALAQLLDVNPHPVRTIEALRAAIGKARGGQ